MGIGVVVPVYNVKKWLDKCIDSLIYQTVAFEQIVIVDDGSTDGSGQIADKYMEMDNHIFVIHQKNRGLGAARNAGLDCISSDYVLFVDSDDYLKQDACEVLSNRLLSDGNNIDALYYDAIVFIDETGNVDKEKTSAYTRNVQLKGKIVSGIKFLSLSFDEKYYPTAWGCLYKTGLIKKIGFPEGVYFEDNFTSFAYMVSCEKVDCISEAIYHYRIRSDSIMTSSFNPRKFHDYCLVAVEMLKYMLDNKQKLLEAQSAVSCLGLIICQKVIHYCVEMLSFKMDDSNSNKDMMNYIIKMFLDILDSFHIAFSEKNIARILRLLQSVIALSEQKTSNHELENLKNTLMSLLKKMYVDLFANYGLDFSNRKKIYGIYGMGKHTKGMIDYYLDNIGTINSQLKYYVTDINESICNCRENVRTIKELDNRLDAIIISSSRYGDEMINLVKKYNVGARIIWFYEKEKYDLFSWYIDFAGTRDINLCLEN